TPNNLWAGIALEEADPPKRNRLIEVRPARSVVLIKPNLNLFARVLDAALSHPSVRCTIPLRLNPTLTFGTAGRCQYVNECKNDGTWQIIDIKNCPELERLLATLSSDRNFT